jgi:hypothetical protein
VTRCALFLRGINVGVRNRLPMAELRAMLEAIRCTQVQTYVQSEPRAPVRDVAVPAADDARDRAAVLARRFEPERPRRDSPRGGPPRWPAGGAACDPVVMDPTAGLDATIVGTVVGDPGAPVLAWGRLDAAGVVPERSRGAQVTIETDHGVQHAVDAAPDRLKVPPAKGRRAPWREVAATPLGGLFDDVAPGDHVEVELRGWTVAPGARIAVRVVMGDPVVARALAIVDGAGDPDADARARGALDALDREPAAAPTPAPRATPDAKPKPKPKKPSPKPDPMPWQRSAPVFRWIAIGFAVLAAATARHLALVAGFGASAAMATAIHLTMVISRGPFHGGIAVATTDRWLKSIHPAWDFSRSLTVIVVGWPVVAPIVVGMAIAMPEAAAGLAGALLVAVAAASIALVLQMTHRHRDMLRFARILLRDRAIIEGTVDAPGTPLTHRVRDVVRVDYRRRAGEDHERYRHWSEVATTASAPFRIRTADRTIVVDGVGAWFAAPIVPGKIAPAEGFLLRTGTASNGDSVIARGRVRDTGDGPVLRATGPESLLVFAAPADARRTLIRLTRGWHARAAALLAIGGAAGAAAIVLFTL